jgi:hypothetical protein
MGGSAKGHKSSWGGAGGGGTVTNAANVGAGVGLIFRNLVAGILNIKSLVQGAGISITNGADDITIALPGGGQTVRTYQLKPWDFGVIGPSDYVIKQDLDWNILPVVQSYPVLAFSAIGGTPGIPSQNASAFWPTPSKMSAAFPASALTFDMWFLTNNALPGDFLIDLYLSCMDVGDDPSVLGTKTQLVVSNSGPFTLQKATWIAAPIAGVTGPNKIMQVCIGREPDTASAKMCIAALEISAVENI